MKGAKGKKKREARECCQRLQTKAQDTNEINS